ncbi:hypothetical protein SMIR_40245 [Streptomyces mirabilis]|nr:hypothetical protein [Streptomyces mirabilis]QUW84555.1 hypothetical protein SMIR_40245 [Streptomyces mirabilis]
MSGSKVVSLERSRGSARAGRPWCEPIGPSPRDDRRRTMKVLRTCF